jgi:hypothetical protein
MNRSVETRLRKLETRMAPTSPSRRIHRIEGKTPQEQAAAKAKLIAEGASPHDLFVRLVPGEPDPNSPMFENHRWEGRWVPKDGCGDVKQ